MDATTLRIVLLVLGVVFLAAIYLYETNRRKRESAQARRRVAPQIREPVVTDAAEADHETDPEPSLTPSEEEDTWVNWDDEDTETLRDEFEDLGSMSADHEPPPELQVEDDAEPVTPEQQELFGFSAQEESPVDIPKLIIQINIKAKSEPFNGLKIEKAMKDTGLKMGKLPIYQRVTGDARQTPLFNVASMVEPGIFPSKDVEDFATPGLTLFTQLPAPGDGMAVFSDMLFTAERLATILGGELQDETHSALTKQTIEHLRSQIMEHRRQVQLARSKG